MRTALHVALLLAKTDEKLLAVSASPVALLFSFESSRREIEARRALASGPPELATAVVQPGSSPASRTWLPLGATSRLRLAELVEPDMNAGVARWISARAPADPSLHADAVVGSRPI
jgi:hypothetical protein